MPGQGMRGRKLGWGEELGERPGGEEETGWVWVEAACQDLQREWRWLSRWGCRAGPLKAPDPGLGSSRET